MNPTYSYLKSKAIQCTIMLCLTLLLAQSCVDKSYDWDDMDTSGVFNIPPVMLGDIDKIYLGGLSTTSILPEGLPVTGFKRVLTDTITGIFDGDVMQDFFFEGADTVKIEAKADVVIKEVPGDTRIILYFNAIDYENNRIQEVVIPQQELRAETDQAVNIKIAPKYMKYMEEAKSLELTIAIIADSGTIQIGAEDYIFLKSVIVKTGGYHLDL